MPLKPVSGRVRSVLAAVILSLATGFSLSSQALVNAGPPVLSDQAVVSVVTMWPAGEIYIAFGHSSVRVKDPVTRVDQIYNYGTFAMDDPLFVPRFVYGQLNYSLADYPFKPYFNWDKKNENRIWYEQTLNLTRDEVNGVFRFLVNNAKPENKYYLYDFIKDNCATRVTDVFRSTLGERFKLNPEAGNDYSRTYRMMLDEHVGDRPLWQFCFYLVLGNASDQPVPLEEDDWLPFHLKTLMDNATVEHNGKVEPFVTSGARIFDPPTPTYYGSPEYNPAFVLWPLFAVVAGFFVLKLLRKPEDGISKAPAAVFRILDFVWFLVLGILGLVVWYLNFFSIHTAVKGNWNCLWLLPLYAVTAFWFLFKKPRRWVAWVNLVCAGLTLIPLILWPVWPQAMHPTMIPFMLVGVVRLLSYALRVFSPGRKYPRRT